MSALVAASHDLVLASQLWQSATIMSIFQFGEPCGVNSAQDHIFFFFPPHPSETMDDCISHMHCLTSGQLKPHHPTTPAPSQGIWPVHRGTGAEPAISLLQLSLFPRTFRLQRRKTMKTVVPRSLELIDQNSVLIMIRKLFSG